MSRWQTVSPLPLGEGQGVRAVRLLDRLVLDNGDELTGQFLGIADDTVKFQTDVGPVEVKTDRATAIYSIPRENASRRPRPTSCERGQASATAAGSWPRSCRSMADG